MTEFNDTERESKVKQELVKQQLDRLEADIAQLRIKTQELRNDVIEEVAQHIEKMKVFGNDTISSFAIFIRGMKR
jgi:hydroxymethylpyrimidine/phosphomethylpyrimidine kinase